MRSRLLSILLPLLVVLLGCGAAWYLLQSKPKPQRAIPMPTSPVVLTKPAAKGTAPLRIRSLGTVKPAQETVIRTRVAGTVTETRLEPGSRVAKGTVLLRIDPADYQNDVRLKESALAKAKAEYDLELGQQKVARAELETLRKTLPGAVPATPKDTALALRAPYLAQAKAALRSAEVELEQARLNLERTTITAPFNGLITERSVSPGSQASTSDALATLAGTDAYWIEAAVPLDRLHALGISRYAGIPVRVISSTGQNHAGTILHAIGTLDSATRMGRMLIEVPDPLGLNAAESAPPLMLGDQVSVELEPKTLEDVIVLPRSALRGNGTVWIAKDGTLDIRPVVIAWKDTENVYLSEGVHPGELVVLSDLAAPVRGMPIRLAADRTPSSERSRP